MDKQDICLIIFIIFIACITVFLASADAAVYGDILLDPTLEWPKGTYAMTMCKLIYEDPYYDCSVIWIMIYVPEDAVNKYCHIQNDGVGLNWVVAGCAFIPYDPDEEARLFIVGNLHGAISHTGQSVLHHELMHMMCKCNFHD